MYKFINLYSIKSVFADVNCLVSVNFICSDNFFINNLHRFYLYRFFLLVNYASLFLFPIFLALYLAHETAHILLLL